MSAESNGANGEPRMTVPNGRDHSNGSNGGDGAVNVSLNEEQLAAVDGWRAANRIDSREQAVQELVRLGLLSEIARVYRMISGVRGDPDAESEDEIMTPQ